MGTVYSPFISELRERQEFEGAFLVKVIQLHLDKNGRPYLNLILADKTGEVEARAWDNATKLADEVKPQDVLRIAGKVNLYQGRKQVIIEAVSRVPDGTYPMDRFLASSAYDVQKLYQDMLALMQSLESGRALAIATLQDEDVKKRLLRAPAAKSVHHAYAGGLLEHALSVCRVLDKLYAHYKLYYGPALSRDLLLLGGLFHDIGKIYELQFERGTEYSREGQLLGHHVLGCELVDRMAQKTATPPELALHLKHIILAHHGKHEYGSPKVPHTIEALLVHYVDDLDSKVNSIFALLAAESPNPEWTQMHKLFERPFWKNGKKPEFVGESPGM